MQNTTTAVDVEADELPTIVAFGLDDLKFVGLPIGGDAA